MKRTWNGSDYCGSPPSSYSRDEWTPRSRSPAWPRPQIPVNDESDQQLISQLDCLLTENLRFYRDVKAETISIMNHAKKLQGLAYVFHVLSSIETIAQLTAHFAASPIGDEVKSLVYHNMREMKPEFLFYDVKYNGLKQEFYGPETAVRACRSTIRALIQSREDRWEGFIACKAYEQQAVAHSHMTPSEFLNRFEQRELYPELEVLFDREVIVEAEYFSNPVLTCYIHGQICHESRETDTYSRFKDKMLFGEDKRNMKSSISEGYLPPSANSDEILTKIDAVRNMQLEQQKCESEILALSHDIKQDCQRLIEDKNTEADQLEGKKQKKQSKLLKELSEAVLGLDKTMTAQKTQLQDQKKEFVKQNAAIENVGTRVNKVSQDHSTILDRLDNRLSNKGYLALQVIATKQSLDNMMGDRVSKGWAETQMESLHSKLDMVLGLLRTNAAKIEENRQQIQTLNAIHEELCTHGSRNDPPAPPPAAPPAPPPAAPLVFENNPVYPPANNDFGASENIPLDDLLYESL